MNLAEPHADPEPTTPADADTVRQPTRRRILRIAGAGGSALLLATVGGAVRHATRVAPVAAGDEHATPVPRRNVTPVRLSRAELAVALGVARTCAVYPVPFPSFGERGRATSRATKARLMTRLAEVDAQRGRQIRDGARSLISAGLSAASGDRLLDGIGRKVSGSDPNPPEGLVAVVALAIATVSTSFDPNSDNDGALWLGAVRHRHMRLAQEPAIRKARQ